MVDRRLIEELELCINNNTKVIVFCEESYFMRDLFCEFCQSDILMKSEKDVLLMAPFKDIVLENGIYKQIEKDECAYLHKLYNTYEFSNRICFISESNQYGSMLNYVNQGIITKEELFEAWLH